MKVFVTGHKGYIGVHLVDLLKAAGHTVTGCDLGIFDGCAWDAIVPADRDLAKDVRDITLQDLAGHDCVMHLAAISNDPMGEVDAGCDLRHQSRRIDPNCATGEKSWRATISFCRELLGLRRRPEA